MVYPDYPCIIRGRDSFIPKGTYEARFEMLDTTRFGEFIELHYVRK